VAFSGRLERNLTIIILAFLRLYKSSFPFHILLPFMGFSSETNFSTMERLSDDELTIIDQEIAKCGTLHLMSFMRVSKTHVRISKMHTVLRAASRLCRSI